jgi:hypothetical protein
MLDTESSDFHYTSFPRKRESILTCHSERNEESSSLYIVVGGSPTANYFLLFVQKKVIKENHTPLPLFSFGLSAASGAAAELALSALKQSSPPTICRSSRRRGKGIKTS